MSCIASSHSSDTSGGTNRAILADIARAAKARMLRMHYESGVGHIGGGLSCIDILVALYHSVLQPDDKFILSKGHAAGALYAALWSVGKLSDSDLDTFHHENTELSAHPAPNRISEIPFATGSLGHGFSLSNGLALAKKLKHEQGRIFCVTSDGEWQEGSTWEALIFALHHTLPVTVVIDANRLQGFGLTAEVAGMENLAERIRAFGAQVVEIDGHDFDQITDACTTRVTGVRVCYAHTNKGNGVTFMSGKMEWHYLPLTEELYADACEQLGFPGSSQ